MFPRNRKYFVLEECRISAGAHSARSCTPVTHSESEVGWCKKKDLSNSDVFGNKSMFFVGERQGSMCIVVGESYFIRM